MSDSISLKKSLIILHYLQRESDCHHKLSMADLVDCLQQNGIYATRKGVYEILQALKDLGYKIHFSRKQGKQGYWIEHELLQAEAFILCDAAERSTSLSRQETDELLSKVENSLSIYEKDAIQNSLPRGEKSQTSILPTIQKLLEAIDRHQAVEFLYYDLTVTKKRKYRKNSTFYQQVPYAIITSGQRAYCVFYSLEHHDFGNYRIDKMDAVSVLPGIMDPIPFDLSSWLQKSFQMYTGDKVTVVIEADLSLTSVVFDQFGTDIIISDVSGHTFTAAIRTALTPTLTAWLLQFYDRITVKRPKQLIDDLMKIASVLKEKYN